VSVIPPFEVFRSYASRASRSSAGRFTGAFSRIIGGTSTLTATGDVSTGSGRGLTGWWVHRAIESAMREQRIADLNDGADTHATPAASGWASSGSTY
jgi:hypothetical protein